MSVAMTIATEACRPSNNPKPPASNPCAHPGPQVIPGFFGAPLSKTCFFPEPPKNPPTGEAFAPTARSTIRSINAPLQSSAFTKTTHYNIRLSPPHAPPRRHRAQLAAQAGRTARLATPADASAAETRQCFDGLAKSTAEFASYTSSAQAPRRSTVLRSPCPLHARLSSPRETALSFQHARPCPWKGPDMTTSPRSSM